MLDRLVDFLLASIRLFQFCVIVRTYQQGVVLRYGKFHRLIEPGFHWLIPFAIEEALTENVVLEIMTVGPQSLTTKDDIPIVISTKVSFTVVDVKTFLLSIEGAGQVIEDSTYGVVASYITARTWTELLAADDLANKLTIKVRAAAKIYGVDIVRVQLADFTRSRSLRLIQPVHYAFKQTAAATAA